ncbi:hypothetical protein [Microbulbifer epialgicus]|uniref:Uncharacterized protein n=1 Tax=Microbulbifer epialgicus TaxID=393907 RepID=A0ABV4P8L8_9GAMM
MNRWKKLKLCYRWNWGSKIIFELWGESFFEVARLGRAIIERLVVVILVLIAIPLYLLKAILFPMYHYLMEPAWRSLFLEDKPAESMDIALSEQGVANVRNSNT